MHRPSFALPLKREHRNKLKLHVQKCASKPGEVFTSIAKSEHVEKSRAPLDTENANALEATLLGIPFFIGMKTDSIGFSHAL